MSKQVETLAGKGKSLILKPRIPVPANLKTIVPPFEQWGFSDDFFKLMNAKYAIDYMKQIPTGGAFISHRSHYYKKAYHGITAYDLKEIHQETS